MPLLAATFFSWRPEEASSVAGRVDGIFNVLLIASAILVFALVGLNLTFLIRYRQGSSAPRPPLRISTNKIEAAWIIGATVAFIAFFFGGAFIYLDINRPPPDAAEIRVVARQWMWDVRHANGRREFDQLHVPVNQPIRLVMSSEDVIHSFYVPAFRVKQDVVPGKFVSTWFEATREGTYHLFCAEFCGTKHSEMGGTVVVMAPEAYAQWLASGETPVEVTDRGRQLFQHYGCSGCHAPASPIHAPPLEGVYQSLVPLADGTFVRADDRYLRDSIMQPTREVAAGYEPIMPSFEGVIPDNDLLDLLTYLKSLRGPPPVSAPAPTPRPLP